MRPIRIDKFQLDGESIEPGLYCLTDSTTKSNSLIPELSISFSLRSNSRQDIAEVTDTRVLVIPKSGSYLEQGDVVSVSANQVMRVLLAKRAGVNTLLVTEQCDNLCKFCSQPPKNFDDRILFAHAAMAIEAYDGAGEIGISGGEPTLNRSLFLNFLENLERFGSNNSYHMLTNGRAFRDYEFVSKVRERLVNLPVMFGIPLYSHIPEKHDLIVGATGAWEETCKGLINMMHAGLNVELRFIPCSINADHLEEFLHFASTSFRRLSQISIMNMEPQGWAKQSWGELYVSPRKYPAGLITAIQEAEIRGAMVRLFNMPLCHLRDSNLFKYAVKSISDWKNYYPEECDTCIQRSQCGGFFTSAKGKFLDAPEAIFE